MQKPFEDVVKETIAFHRAEIARLDRALRAYAEPDVATSPRSVMPRVRITEEAKQRTRVSKYEGIFLAFEAARRPLSLDDMIGIARDHGFDIDRGNMRSTVHTQKNLGRARAVGDGYVWGVEATSSPKGETGGANPRPASPINGQNDRDAEDGPSAGGI